MNASRLRWLLVFVLWGGSLAAAYYFGKSSRGSGGSARSSVQVVTNRPDGLPAASGAGTDSVGAGGAASGSESAGSAEVDIRGLIAKVRTQIGAGPGMMYNPTAMMKAMAPLADLSEAQVREALEEVEATVNNPQQKVMFYSLLLGRLAETDGAGAMAYVEENIEGQGGYATGITMSVIGTWARRDPEAAWEWFVENRDQGNSGGMGGFGQVSAVFSGIASKDMDVAFRRLEELEDFEKTQAISGIAMGGFWDPEYREKVLDRAESLPAETRQALHQGMIGQWTMSDPDSAIEWLGSLPAEERQPLAQQAGTMLMMTNPERGAEMMLENATEEQLSGTYATIVGQWARRDPNAAGEWLNQQPAGTDLDMARAAFSRNVVQRDPISAMEWAKTVENEGSKNIAIQQVYRQWKVKDAAAADAALDSSGLTSDKIEEIRKNAPETARSRGGAGAIQITR